MGKQVMGYWDCPVCGSKGIRGDVMNCPGCGRARGDVQFYLKNGAENGERAANERGDLEYLDDAKAKEMGKNPDWYCSFCNSLNKDNAAFCSNCGASRENSESNYFDQLKKKKEAEQAEAAAQAQSRPAPRKSGKPLVIILAVVAVLIGVFVYFNGNKTRTGLEVTDLAWSRTVPVEQYLEFSESDWSVPEGGKITSQKSELHHMDTVLDHYQDVEVERSRQVVDHYETYYTYTDNGNGSFDEVAHERPVYRTEYYTETVQQPVYVQVPRYQTKYYYQIWRWQEVRRETASGTDHNACWPELKLAEDEREGENKEERYTFTVVDEKGNKSTYSLPEADWRNIQVNDSLSISAKRTGADVWLMNEKGEKTTRLTPVK